MEKKSRNTMIMVILFSSFAIVFAILNVVGIIKNLNSYLAMTYMSYFLGLALMYLSTYHKRNEKYTSMYVCLVSSIILILVAVASLIYGLCTGEITLFL